MIVEDKEEKEIGKWFEWSSFVTDSTQSTPNCLLWGLTLKGQQWKLSKEIERKKAREGGR